jgi:hypothetical protein
MHPYRDAGEREAKLEDEPSLDSSIRMARTMVGSWALLRVVVAVVQHGLPVEAATAALLMVIAFAR